MKNPGALPPYPNGWYCVGTSSDLSPGKILSQQFMGQDIVLFRTKSGVPSAMSAYCPHLGAHFGYGGTVEDETIRCPFHYFCFDTSGECVSTGYGTKPPPKATVPTWPLRERYGLIFLYHDASGAPPAWDLPDVDLTGWMPLKSTVWTLNSHPQEVTENSVDLGHLTIVHHYDCVEILSDVRTEGAYLTARYAMERSAAAFGQFGQKVRTEFTVHVHGLGFSWVDAHVKTYDIRTRMFVLPTPVEEGTVKLRVGLSLKNVENPGKINPFLALMPRPLVNKLVQHMAFGAFTHDVKQDFVMWENKIYIQPPILADGDGPIGKYRQWVKQFYPELARVTV